MGFFKRLLGIYSSHPAVFAARQSVLRAAAVRLGVEAAIGVVPHSPGEARGFVYVPELQPPNYPYLLLPFMVEAANKIQGSAHVSAEDASRLRAALELISADGAGPALFRHSPVEIAVAAGYGVDSLSSQMMTVMGWVKADVDRYSPTGPPLLPSVVAVMERTGVRPWSEDQLQQVAHEDGERCIKLALAFTALYIVEITR